VPAEISPLPAAVRLPPQRSLLPLGRHARLIGLDPELALAVDDLPEPLARMLDELACPVAPGALVERAVRRGADAGQARTLLDRLVAAGAVVDADYGERVERHRRASAVVVVGAGPLGVGIAAGLALAGVGAVHVEAAGPVLAADLGTGYVDGDRGRERAAAAAAAVRRLVPAAVTGPARKRVVPDLVVLADAAAPDPVRVGRLLTAGTAHLLVHMRDGTGVVGPLVLPARTACLRCLELHRSDRDPAWPAVAAQLVGRVGRATPACVAATAALATAQAVTALDGSAAGAEAPAVLDATLEFEPSGPRLIRRIWTPHVRCGCGAAAPGSGSRRAARRLKGGQS
jgi:molybdopterin/thiamine biosynthesis adenylyltransferase